MKIRIIKGRNELIMRAEQTFNLEIKWSLDFKAESLIKKQIQSEKVVLNVTGAESSINYNSMKHA